MGDRIRKWIAVLLAGSILAMIQLVPAGGAVFVRENIENKEILGEKETSLQQTLHARAWVLMDVGVFWRGKMRIPLIRWQARRRF